MTDSKKKNFKRRKNYGPTIEATVLSVTGFTGLCQYTIKGECFNIRLAASPSMIGQIIRFSASRHFELNEGFPAFFKHIEHRPLPSHTLKIGELSHRQPDPQDIVSSSCKIEQSNNTAISSPPGFARLD